MGELKKLALKASRSTVRRVLLDERILPDPERHAPKGVQTPWRKFIAIHMNVMVACDFFCKTVWTPLGKHMAYMLTFVKDITALRLDAEMDKYDDEEPEAVEVEHAWMMAG